MAHSQELVYVDSSDILDGNLDKVRMLIHELLDSSKQTSRDSLLTTSISPHVPHPDLAHEVPLSTRASVTRLEKLRRTRRSRTVSSCGCITIPIQRA
jgi:hypothetical protein